MNSCFLEIKRKIQILVITLNLVSFIIITSIISKKKDYIEYTSLSKICSNLYIFLFYILILIQSIYPKIFYKFFLENISFITTDIGKLCINFGISILYWSSNNAAHIVFGVITFVSSFGLFLCEFIFQCRILNDVQYDKSININREKSISNSNIIEDNNN